jgi:hypothetical protein
MVGYIKTQQGDLIKINYEHERVVDGTVANIFFNGEEVSTMLYSSDLNQWNDCLNPGEVSGETDIECALNTVAYYKK